MKNWHIEIDNSKSLDLPAPLDLESTIADWLGNHGIELNLRCGKRGICRGCRVQMDSKEVKACETRISDIPDSITTFRIPPSSQHNHSLHGVSIFEVNATDYPTLDRKGLGIAMDIGTTTIAAALWDLENNRMLAHTSVSNAQRRFGDDVISRIEFSSTGKAEVLLLQQTLVDASIQPLVDQLTEVAGIAKSQILHAVATGNTVMLHTLLGMSLTGFAAYPFEPLFLQAQVCSGDKIGLPSKCQVMTPPNLGAFVGSDIVAGAIACGFLHEKGNTLLLDFGTNGEILLKTNRGIYATATAAGPAFEGGRLCCGATASDTVVSKFVRTPEGWKCLSPGGDVIERPSGISGAAYVSLLSYLLENEVINIMGRMDPKHPWVSPSPEHSQKSYRVIINDTTYLTESDIAEIMQAKAAVGAGIIALCEHAAVSVTTLETIFVAGGFGYNLDLSSAIAIGMIPKMDISQIKIVGNASLAGASLLLQQDASKDLELLSNACEVVELNKTQHFADAYMESMLLGPLNGMH